MWSLAGITVALALLGACDKVAENAQPSRARPPEGTFMVRERMAPDYKAVSAVVTHRNTSDARARIGGRLSQLLVREGDEVSRDQLLAVITDERIASETRAAAASQAAAQAASEQAQRDLARAEKLFAEQAISQSALEAARTQARTSTASLQATQAQAQAARAAQRQGEIRAPSDGTVVQASIPQGSVVLPGDLVVAISTGEQVLRIEMPESEGRSLAEGVEIALLPEDGSGAGRKARIRQVYPAVRNGRVTVDLETPGLTKGSLIGERVRVMVPVGERIAIVIPRRFVDTRYGADYVRLARESTAVDVPVQVGSQTPLSDMTDGVEVLSGLRDGDRLLLPGVEK
jgi:RND family efflux transporter MFP subunit